MPRTWKEEATKALVDRKIVLVRWMTQEEYEAFGWYQSAIVLQLDDGSLLFPMRDDEGNGPGALSQQWEDRDETWPTGVKEGS